MRFRILYFVFVGLLCGLDKPGYRNIVRSPLRLPEFHAPHFGFQTEWWYYTGFFRSESGERFGIQFTLFKSELSPGIRNALDLRILSLQHFAVTDLNKGTFAGFSDALRNSPGISSWVPSSRGLRFAGQGGALHTAYELNGDLHLIRVRSARALLDTKLRAVSDPVFHGDGGYSIKTHSGSVSWYISIPELRGPATLNLEGRTHKGTLEMWMDHEVSSRFTDEGAEGWDWLHFRMADGTRITGFRVRGRQDYHYARRLAAGRETDIGMSWKPIEWRKSASGTHYPVSWLLSAGGETWKVRAIVDDCEMPGYLPYWEGPVEVSDAKGQTGLGYLEMTGYRERLPFRF